ncbi:MAG: acyl carrier protein [Aquabacterium sp.]
MITEIDLFKLIKQARIDFPEEPLRPDIALVDQGVHSLDMAVLFFELEKKFSVSIPTDVVGRLRSLDDILEFLNGAAVRAGVLQ